MILQRVAPITNSREALLKYGFLPFHLGLYSFDSPSPHPLMFSASFLPPSLTPSPSPQLPGHLQSVKLKI